MENKEGTTLDKPDFKQIVKESFFGLSENETDWTAEGMQWLWHHKHEPLLSAYDRLQNKTTALQSEVSELKREVERLKKG